MRASTGRDDGAAAEGDPEGFGTAPGGAHRGEPARRRERDGRLDVVGVAERPRQCRRRDGAPGTALRGPGPRRGGGRTWWRTSAVVVAVVAGTVVVVVAVVGMVVAEGRLEVVVVEGPGSSWRRRWARPVLVIPPGRLVGAAWTACGGWCAAVTERGGPTERATTQSTVATTRLSATQATRSRRRCPAPSDGGPEAPDWCLAVPVSAPRRGGGVSGSIGTCHLQAGRELGAAARTWAIRHVGAPVSRCT